MMPSAFRFVRARIPAGANQTAEVSVTVRDGKIDALDAPSGALPEVDLQGLWLLPGAIDGHVHFDEPGFTHREDFASGTAAAAAGGLTTIVDMPCTSLPPVVDGAAFDNKLGIVGPKARIDFALWGGVRGNDFGPEAVEKALTELAQRGVRSIKTYLISGMDTFCDLSVEQLQTVMGIAKKLDLTVGVHAEDREMIREAIPRERQLADGDRPAAYVRSRSAEAEAKGVASAIGAAENTGARLHIVHLGCGEGVRLVREAKARGVRVTAETCPHYLAFTQEDLDRLGGLLKTAPVVKSADDQKSLWQGLVDGTLDMIATDHAPGLWPQEKTTGSIWTDYGGVPGVETMLPYVLSEGVFKRKLSLERALELVCSGPAKVHRLANKGRLAVGADADLVVFDPHLDWLVQAEHCYTRQKYTPFEGMRFRGRVLGTYVRGVQVFDWQRGPLGESCGRLVNNA